MSHFEEVFEYTGRAKKDSPAKRKHGFSKFWVSFLILTIIAYVATVFYFVWHGKYVPDSLNYTFLPAIFGQLANMAFIARKGKDVEIAEIQASYHYDEKGGFK